MCLVSIPFPSFVNCFYLKIVWNILFSAIHMKLVSSIKSFSFFALAIWANTLCADQHVGKLFPFLYWRRNILLQLMCLADLELDYINPYDSASRINKVVMADFVTQASLCLLHLVAGHWTMFILCLPYVYYNVTL